MAITRHTGTRRRSAVIKQPSNAESSESEKAPCGIVINDSEDSLDDAGTQAHTNQDADDDTIMNDATQSVVQTDDPWTAVYLQLGRVRSPQAATMKLRPSLQQVSDGVHAQLTQLIEHGIANSALVIGPRGSGKTLAVERALARVCNTFNKDPADPAVAVVRLSGLVHPDERSMCRDMSRQLCNAYGLSFIKHASYDSNILFVQEVMAQLHSARKAVVFVMEEFDALVASGKQTVLYTLVDAMRHTQAQAAIVAVSTCHDVFETLEKRVQSRFVHSKFGVEWYCFSQQPGECIGDMLESMLVVPANSCAAAVDHNAAVKRALTAKPVKEALRKMSLHCTVRDVATVACLAANRAQQSSNGTLQPQHVVDAVHTHAAVINSMAVACIPDISIVEAFVLVACARCAVPDVRSTDEHAIRFAHVWEQLSRLAANGAGVDAITNRTTALRAYERLAMRACIAPANVNKRPSRASWLEHAPMELRVSRQEIQAGLNQHPNAPQALLSWLTQHAVVNASALDDVDMAD